MSPALIGLLAFIAISLGATALLFLVRDLAAGSATRDAGAFRLARLPLARNEPKPQSFIGEFDQWLLRTVQEAGCAWSPLTSALFLLLFALGFGGALFVGTDEPVAAAVGALAGFVVALAVLIISRRRRVRQLQEQLPPALDMLARAVRAGESLDQAITLVGQKSPEPLATEFRRAAHQLEMGLSMSAAMRALVYRVRLVDMRIFTTTLTVHRRTGGNLATTLERLAAVIRERLTYRRQVRAATAAGRVSSTLIATVGPLLFAYLFLFHPDYVRGLLVDPLGRSLLALAVFLDIVGLIWVARLMRTD